MSHQPPKGGTVNPCLKTRLAVGVTVLLIGLMLGLRVVAAASDDSSQTRPAQSETAGIVAAANAFLATLDDKQRAKVLYKFDDKEQRARWSNFPTGFVPRGGINLQGMNEAQRSAALALVAAVLSPKGFEKVQQIREADDVFKATDHGPPPFANGPPGGPPPAGDQGDHGPPPLGNEASGGHRGPPPPPGGFKPGGLDSAMFGQYLYYISFLGTPSEKDPWMLQFGGHHLALNITIAGPRGVLTPSLTGAQPATFTVNGQTVRPLGRENDQGLALLHALDEAQRNQAILKYRVADLVLGPGHDGETILPEGLKASAMNEKQRAMLLDLISQWSGIINDTFATARLAEIKAGLDDTWFAWSGPTNAEPGKNITAYYRIQGPKVVIEYAPQHAEDHIHTMYRDPTNDYGQELTTGK